MQTDSEPSDPESDLDGAEHWQPGSTVNERLRGPAAALVGGVDSTALFSDYDENLDDNGGLLPGLSDDDDGAVENWLTTTTPALDESCMDGDEDWRATKADADAVTDAAGVTAGIESGGEDDAVANDESTMANRASLALDRRDPGPTNADAAAAADGDVDEEEDEEDEGWLASTSPLLAKTQVIVSRPSSLDASPARPALRRRSSAAEVAVTMVDKALLLGVAIVSIGAPAAGIASPCHESNNGTPDRGNKTAPVTPTVPVFSPDIGRPDFDSVGSGPPTRETSPRRQLSTKDPGSPRRPVNAGVGVPPPSPRTPGAQASTDKAIHKAEAYLAGNLGYHLTSFPRWYPVSSASKIPCLSPAAFSSEGVDATPRKMTTSRKGSLIPGRCNSPADGPPLRSPTPGTTSAGSSPARSPRSPASPTSLPRRSEPATERALAGGPPTKPPPQELLTVSEHWPTGNSPKSGSAPNGLGTAAPAGAAPDSAAAEAAPTPSMLRSVPVSDPADNGAVYGSRHNAADDSAAADDSSAVARDLKMERQMNGVGDESELAGPRGCAVQPPRSGNDQHMAWAPKRVDDRCGSDETATMHAMLSDELAGGHNPHLEGAPAEGPGSVNPEPATDPRPQEQGLAVPGTAHDDQVAQAWSGFALSMVAKMSALTTQLSGDESYVDESYTDEPYRAGDAAGACDAVDGELAALRSRVAQLEGERDPRVLGGIRAELGGIHRTLQDRTAELEGMRMRNTELHAKLRAAEADRDQLRADLGGRRREP